MPLTECTLAVWAIFTVVDPEAGEVEQARPVLAWDESGAPRVLGTTGLVNPTQDKAFLRLSLDLPVPPERKPTITRPGGRPPKAPGRDPR